MAMKDVIDNFSTGGADYALYRPESPREVFDFIFSHVKNFDTAWDCGTGNGQVAAVLADRFKTVYGTDISEDQLKYAIQKDNITYRKERVEQTSFADKSIDLITVGQAIHWFDFDPFYEEVSRVAATGAFFAAWTYSLLQLTPAVNEVINHFYYDITHHYWDKQRYYVDDGYKTIPFPFKEIQAPEIWITKHYTQQQLIGYLRTWSGVKNYIKKVQQDPTDLILKDLARAWGNKEQLEVLWPVHVRAGYVN
jgi:ubiquinone/menaquinone biosynthesis C-methylase UbiE